MNVEYVNIRADVGFSESPPRARIKIDGYRAYVGALVGCFELDTTGENLDQRIATSLSEWLGHVRMKINALSWPRLSRQ